MESPEYRALVNCGSDLQELIKHGFRQITPSLLAEGLISQDTNELTQLDKKKSDIASGLMCNVTSSIKTSPILFYKFLECLKDCGEYYLCVVQKLEKQVDQLKSTSGVGKNVYGGVLQQTGEKTKAMMALLLNYKSIDYMECMCA